MDERIEAVVIHQCPFSAERVFDCWLRPESVRRWMKAALQTMGLPGDLGTIEADPRVGGKFQFSDMRPMGEACHWGTYKVIDRPHRLAFTWNASDKFDETDDELSLVSIVFTTTTSGCQVRLAHSIDAQWRDYLERTTNGWNNMLVNIFELLKEQDEGAL